MDIWVVTVGEPLPIDGGRDRLLRAGLLCPILTARGHRVTWWTSDFDHVRKQHRFGQDHVEIVSPAYQIRLAHGCGYKNNISLARLLDHWQIARKFSKQAERLPVPDVIVCSFPTIEHSDAAVRYGKRHGVPVVIDVRDLWPDIFLPLVPTPLRPLASLVLRPYFFMAKRALKGAAAIFGITDGFLQWGLHRADRARRPHDRAIPMGYPSTKPHADDIARAREFWRERGIGEDDRVFTSIFVGTIGRQVQLETVVEAAKLLGPEFRFVICGTGDRFDELRSHAAGLSNVVLPGWVGAAEIWSLMRIAQVGLTPYHDEPSFTESLPNKSLEYLSAGLPIVSSLPGALEELLGQHHCGLTYKNRDVIGLAEYLQKLRDPEARQGMATNAAKLFETRFRAEIVYREMAEQIEAIAKDHGRGSIGDSSFRPQ